MRNELVNVATLSAYRREVEEDTAVPAAGQVLAEGVGERSFREIESAECRVTGSLFLIEARTIEPEPAAVVTRSWQLPDGRGMVER